MSDQLADSLLGWVGLMSQTLVDTLGWIGSIEILIAYALVSMERMPAKSPWYQLLNFTGSIFLVINTLYYKAYPSTFLNVVWGMVAVAILIKTLGKTKKPPPE